LAAVPAGVKKRKKSGKYLTGGERDKEGEKGTSLILGDTPSKSVMSPFPPRRSCQPFLRQRGIPPERVYYSFNYNTPAGQRLARLYIVDEIASMNLLYGR
jgi:hypothetical protein